MAGAPLSVFMADVFAVTLALLPPCDLMPFIWLTHQAGWTVFTASRFVPDSHLKAPVYRTHRN